MLKASGVRTVVASDFSPGRRALLATACGADVVVDPGARRHPFSAAGDRGHVEGPPVRPRARRRDPREARPGARRVVARPGALAEKLGAAPKHPVIFECVGVPGVIESILDGAPLFSRVVVAGVCVGPDRFTPAMAINKELDLRFIRRLHAARVPRHAADAGRGRGRPAPAHHRRGRARQASGAAFAALGDPERHAKILIDPRSAATEPVAAQGQRPFFFGRSAPVRGLSGRRAWASPRGPGARGARSTGRPSEAEPCSGGAVRAPSIPRLTPARASRALLAKPATTERAPTVARDESALARRSSAPPVSGRGDARGHHGPAPGPDQRSRSHPAGGRDRPRRQQRGEGLGLCRRDLGRFSGRRPPRPPGVVLPALARPVGDRRRLRPAARTMHGIATSGSGVRDGAAGRVDHRQCGRSGVSGGGPPSGGTTAASTQWFPAAHGTRAPVAPVTRTSVAPRTPGPAERRQRLGEPGQRPPCELVVVHGGAAPSSLPAARRVGQARPASATAPAWWGFGSAASGMPVGRRGARPGGGAGGR